MQFTMLYGLHFTVNTTPLLYIFTVVCYLMVNEVVLENC